MADKKITELDELETPAVGDWFAIVDIDAGPAETKKITLANIVPVKATGAEINTGTDDAKFTTSKAIEDSNLSFTSDAETLSNKLYLQTLGPAADTAKGTIMYNAAGENLALGSVCYMSVYQEFKKADASGVATAPAIAIATEAIDSGYTGYFLTKGVFHLNTLAPGWTIGAFVYLSETAGLMTQTAPTTTDSVIQILGIATGPDVLYFNPQLVMVEHT